MIDTIRLQNFRSYQDSSFEFGSRVNIIVGPNGSGKTNLLEAVQILASGKSYRVHDEELVMFDAPWSRLDAQIDGGTMTRTVKLQTGPRFTKTYELQDKSYQRLLRPHTLPLVLFEPNHLLLLHGPPELRRNYIDEILDQTSPGYESFRRNYRRVLSQRNALLKRGHVSPDELFPWDLRLSELGAVMARRRAEIVGLISKRLPELYRLLSGSEVNVTIRYVPQFPVEHYETALLHKLQSSYDHEMARGFTAYGPHREDFVVEFDSKLATETASRGETRTVILALKILELEFIEQARGTTPLLLLDDVFSELDGSRRRALTGYLQTHQTFLTTTDADVVIKHFTDSTIIPLS